ncbi:MAG: cell division protein ZapA [Acidimicrobiia bacterium]|nr:cell division protein ZapA [Acidimicrobiia bacterium]
MSARVVTVEIHGQRYAVKSDLDQAYITELATYVDQKMTLAADELSSADSLRIAVIAALNLADELYRARADSVGIEGHVKEKTEAIERLVDAVLSGQQRIAV